MFCPNCGAPIEIAASKFCGNCGENIENVSALLDEWHTAAEEEQITDIPEPIGVEPEKEAVVFVPDTVLFDETYVDSQGYDGVLEEDEEDDDQSRLSTLTEKLRSVGPKKAAIIAVSVLAGVGIIAAVAAVAAGGGENKQVYTAGSNPAAPFQGSSAAGDDSQISDEFLSNRALMIKASNEMQEIYAPISYEWLIRPEIQADDIQMAVRRKTAYDDGVPDYNSTEKFKYDRVSVIRKNNEYGLIAYNGLPMCDVYFNNIYVGYDGKYLLERFDNNVYYTLNGKYEQVKLTDPASISAISGEADSPLLIWVESESCLYDSDGNRCDSYQKAAAALYLDSYDSIFGLTVDDDSRYILVNRGTPITRVLFENAGNFNDGVIPVMLDGKWGYVDQNGSVVLPFEFDDTFENRAYHATDKLIVVKKDGLYALFSVDGSKLIQYGEFDQLRPSYNGMLWAKSNGRWGVISVSEGAHDIQPDTPFWEDEEYTAEIRSADGLRLREKADTDSAVLGILSNHQEVTVLTVSDDWAYIRVKEGVYGWVKGEYLQ